ncbi:MAG: group II intron reverse transcriptase/maturase [Chitinophagaceae bacterium]|nr:group II intron reverse transcriptase/maturase [Chitinophagaceae bacterium]
MLEKILDIRNIERACKQVIKNKGAGGIDGMQTDELRDFLQASWASIRKEILEGRYEPDAVKRVEIPKPNGGVRGLGIPTVKDRLIQQAISQWMSGLWEQEFSEHSYGFRPQKNAHQAVYQAQTYLNEDKTYVIEMDLEKFFDKVNHDKLMSLISRKVADKRSLKLIGKYLRSGILHGGLVTIPKEGTPQGSPLSPLLSNIMLHELDMELQSRGLSFVRYADDCSIYVRSLKSAHRVMERITKYLECKLRLKVNREKSKVSRPTESKLLGYSFYKKKKEWRLRIAPKSVKRMKDKIRSIFKRSLPEYPETYFPKFGVIVRGWVNYFIEADCKSTLKKLDELVRTRVRQIYWHKWKRAKTRMRKLMRFSVPQWQAYQWANSSKGSCRIAHSPIMSKTLSIKHLNQEGLASFYSHYRPKEVQLSIF